MESESRELLLALAMSALRLTDEAMAECRHLPRLRHRLLEDRIHKLGRAIALLAALSRSLR